jgi:hypothetical protein
MAGLNLRVSAVRAEARDVLRLVKTLGFSPE